MMRCTKCNREATLANSRPAGPNSLAARIHYPCDSISTAIKKRLKTDVRFKNFWTNASDVEKFEYYDRQARLDQPGRGQARVWDDYQVTSYEKNERGKEDRVRIHWQPFSVFESDKLIRGWEPGKIKAEWDRITSDINTGAKKVMGEWVIPVFAGLISDMVDSSMTGSSFERRGAAHNADHAAELRHEAEEVSAAAALEYQRVQNAQVGELAAPSYTANEADINERPEPVRSSALAQAISCGLKRKLQREEHQQKQMEEAIDRHEQSQTDGDGNTPKKKREATLDMQKLAVWQWVQTKKTSLETFLATQLRNLEDMEKELSNTIVMDLGSGELLSKARVEDSMKAALKRFKEKVNTFIEEKLARDLVDAIVDPVGIKPFKDAIAEAEQQLKKDSSLNDFRDAYNASTKLVKDYNKSLGKKNKNSGEPRSVGSAPKLTLASLKACHQSLGAEFSKGFCNVPADLWKSTSVCMSSDALQKGIQELADMGPFKKQYDWMSKHLAKEKVDACASGAATAAMEKSIAKTKKAIIPENFTTQLGLVGSEKEWGAALFDPELGVNCKDSFSVTMVPYGLADVIMVVQGSALLCVVPAAVCPGTGIQEKVKYMENLGASALGELRQKPKVSMAQVCKGDVAAVPLNCLVAMAIGDSEWRHIRWGAWCHASGNEEANKAETLTAVESMMGAFDQLKTDRTWQAWSMYLNNAD